METKWRGLLFRGALWTFLLSTSGRCDSLTVTVIPGLSTIANPFDHGDNQVSQVLPQVPEGVQLYKFDAAAQRWLANQFQFGAWAQPEQTLKPGEGAFIRNPTNAFDVTFEGTSPTNLVVPIHAGHNLVSMPGDAANQLDPKENDVVQLWDPAQRNYVMPTIYAGGWWYDVMTGLPHDPPFHAGDSVLYQREPSGGEMVPTLYPSVYVNNYAPASGVDAPIFSTYGCFGSTWVVQLYGSDPVVGWRSDGPIGAPVPLLPATGGTYLDAHGDDVRAITNGALYLQLVLWDSRRGSAIQAQDHIGWSEILSFDYNAYSGRFLPPANLDGLKPFALGPITPFIPCSACPIDVSAFEGQSTTLGGPTSDWDSDLFAFQWQKETASNEWADISGATSNVLVFPSIRRADSGSYRRITKYDCASSETFGVLLTVLERPLLRAATIGNEGQVLKLGFTWAPGFSYNIEVSSDLSHWERFTAVTNATDRWDLDVTNAPDDSRRFFRVRLLPQ